MPNPMKQKFSRRARRSGHLESVEEQFKRLRHAMLASDAWRALSGNAIKVYLELCRRYDGRNNGQIHLSQAEAARLLFISKSSVKRALNLLAKLGFVKYATRGSFYGRRAATFILTDCTYQGHQPTNEWRAWRLPENRRYAGLVNSPLGFEAVREAAFQEQHLLKNKP